MNKKYSLFSYKSGNSYIHRIPAWIKILALPILNVFVFFTPIYSSLLFIIVQCITAYMIHFSLREQLEDVKPVFYYAIMLYTTRFIALALSHGLTEGFWLCVSNGETLSMLIKLFCIMQSASLVFKTATSLEIREGIGVIETAIRAVLPVSKKNSFTHTIALFVCFIPMVYSTWEQIKKAWYVRHGKTGIKMYSTLMPVLLSVGMKKAYNAAKAIAARS